MHIVETRSRRQRERERDSLTRTTHPSGYISSRGSRGGRIKKKKKKKRARRILGAYRVEIVRGILQLRNRGQLSDFGRGEQRNNDNNNGQIVLPEIRCDLLRGFFLPLLPYLSLSLCLSSWGRKREEEEREKKKLSRCSDQLTLMSDIFGRLAKLAREPFSYGGMPPRHQKQYTP